jgi:hypothetical protein
MHDNVPGPIHDECRERIVIADDSVERVANAVHFGAVERTLGIKRRETGTDEQLVSHSKRKVQGIAKPQDHVAAGPGSPGLNEAQMPL